MIRYAHHRGIAHFGMLVQDLFNFAGIDVCAAADDQFLLPAHNLEISALVENAEIARGEPSVFGETPRVRFWVVVVADHYGWPAGQDFARNAGGAFVAVVVDDDHAHL